MIVYFVFYVDSISAVATVDIVLFLTREDLGVSPGKTNSLPLRTRGILFSSVSERYVNQFMLNALKLFKVLWLCSGKWLFLLRY